MRRPPLLLCMLSALMLNVATAADTLHHREVNEKNPGGKDLIMTFEELRRDENTSVAKVTFVSGASVPTSMFIVRGFYDIARIRGTGYFVKLKEWHDKDGSWMYLVGFSNDDKVSIKEYFNLNTPGAQSNELQFMSVKDYALIFEPSN
jgi:hypothetical protein